MRKGSGVLILLVLAAMLAPAAAFAAGPGTSAGDQQYIDPLGGSSTSTSSKPSSHPATNSSPAPTPTASAPATSSVTSTATTSATSSAAPATSTSSKPKLPYTGMNAWLAGALGLAMLATGLALRRAW